MNVETYAEKSHKRLRFSCELDELIMKWGFHDFLHERSIADCTNKSENFKDFGNLRVYKFNYHNLIIIESQQKQLKIYDRKNIR
jgi:hypothetical protein